MRPSKHLDWLPDNRGCRTAFRVPGPLEATECTPTELGAPPPHDQILVWIWCDSNLGTRGNAGKCAEYTRSTSGEKWAEKCRRGEVAKTVSI